MSLYYRDRVNTLAADLLRTGQAAADAGDRDTAACLLDLARQLTDGEIGIDHARTCAHLIDLER